MKIKILIALPITLALIGAAGCGYFSKKEIVSYEYGTEKVKNEQFIVAFSEGGQLESVSSVKIESEMDGSSTIVSIVDEGSTVKGPKQVQAQAGDTPASLAKKHGVTEDSLHHVNPDLEQAIEKGESGSGLLDAMMLSLVRRTRHDIRAMQEAGEDMEVNGQPLRFPEHEIPTAINYNLQGLYGNIYIDIIDAIEHLNFAVYRLDEYGVDTGELETTDRVQQRNSNFLGIMRTILLKRMESSLAALTSTVQSLVSYLDLFLVRLDHKNFHL